jgi:hypothetical protein
MFISRPLLCFTSEIPRTWRQALACPKRCPKTATYRSLRSSNRQPGAIGRHNFDLKIDIDFVSRGCRRHQSARPRAVGARTIFQITK